MRGRTGSGRAKAMAQTKMKDKTEAAVIKGLEWLKANQNPDGSWGAPNKAAMTGLALLCFSVMAKPQSRLNTV
jgi:squalene cyclase